MKAILILLLVAAFFISIGQSHEPVAAGQVYQSVRSHDDVVFANSIEQIAGTWYAFPVGLAIRFNNGGTADFGLDAAGRAIGYSARIWFEGQRVFIVFTDFDGDGEDCETAVGSYTVQLLEDGAIAFRPIEDPCRFRLDILGGDPDLGFEQPFQPFKRI
jgi:hypothetical protein